MLGVTWSGSIRRADSKHKPTLTSDLELWEGMAPFRTMIAFQRMYI